MKSVKKSLPAEVTLELGLDAAQDPAALREGVARQLGVDEARLPPVVLRKRSLDCRRGRVRFHLSFELSADGGNAFGFGVDDPARLGEPHPR
jgi:hypothetical protein